jgi:hypothetical protein
MKWWSLVFIVVVVGVFLTAKLWIDVNDCINGGWAPDFNKKYNMGYTLLMCERISFPSTARVMGETNWIGFDAGLKDLNFGAIQEKGSSRRFLNLVNGDDDLIKIRIMPFGNISKYVVISAKEFMMEAGDALNVTLSFVAGEGGEGNYTGGISVIKIKPRYEFLNPLLGWF